MKIKITTIILTALFISLSAVRAEDIFSHLDKETEKKYWDFLSERYFDYEDLTFKTIQQRQIGIYLQDATLQDSLIVRNLITELKNLMPARKFVLVKYIDNEAVTLGYQKIGLLFYRNIDSLDYPLLNSGFEPYFVPDFRDEYGNKIEHSGYTLSKYIYPNYTSFSCSFSFNDTISYTLSKRYIEYSILRSLIRPSVDSNNIHTYVDYAIFNHLSFNPAGTEFKEVDKFLIHKLYSDDLIKQHRSYIINNYSWSEYYKPYFLFLFKNLPAKVVVIIMVVILLIASYKKIFIRKYKNVLLSYIIPGISLAIIISITYVLYNLVFEIAIGQNNWNQIGKVLLLTITVVSGAFTIISFLVYLIEKYILLRLIRKKQILYKAFTLPVLIIVFIIIFFIFSKSDLKLILLELLYITLYGFLIAIARGILLFLKNISELQIQEKEVEISRLKEQKAKAEIQSLNARINPHFLYNSLNSIAGLAHSNPEKTEKMALSLSDLFRYTINRSGKQMSTVKEEIEMVKTYLDIEEIRFGERMSYIINVDKDLEHARVPMYIIQPLVENAIKHGISKISGKGKVTLSVSKSNGDIVIGVEDNGTSFTDGLVSGYGLQSVHDILQLTYGNKAGINWQNEPNKCICVNFPLLIAEK